MLVLSPQQEDPAVGMHTLSQFIAHGLLQPAEPGASHTSSHLALKEAEQTEA